MTSFPLKSMPCLCALIKKRTLNQSSVSWDWTSHGCEARQTKLNLLTVVFDQISQVPGKLIAVHRREKSSYLIPLFCLGSLWVKCGTEERDQNTAEEENSCWLGPHMPEASSLWGRGRGQRAGWTPESLSHPRVRRASFPAQLQNLLSFAEMRQYPRVKSSVIHKLRMIQLRSNESRQERTFPPSLSRVKENCAASQASWSRMSQRGSRMSEPSHCCCCWNSSGWHTQM